MGSFLPNEINGRPAMVRRHTIFVMMPFVLLLALAGTFLIYFGDR